MNRPLRLAVLVSGNGSNLQAIIDAIETKQLNATIAHVIASRADAYALTRCVNHRIPHTAVLSREFATKDDYETAMIHILDQAHADLICLAGFMKLLSPLFVNHYKGRLINIHPSLLPAFPGIDAIGQALAAHATTTGVTVHFVDEGCDTGPIILQEKIAIAPTDNHDTLAQKIHTVEHRLFVDAIRQFANQINI